MRGTLDDAELLHLRSAIIAAPEPAAAPAGQLSCRHVDPQQVRVVLHPRGVERGGVRWRSWLRFHNRLPALLLPDVDDPRAKVELVCRDGDVMCIVAETSGRNVQSKVVVTVAEVPGRWRGPGSTALVRIAAADTPVRLLVHLSGAAANRFVRHLDLMESHGIDVSVSSPAYWTHLAATVDAGVPAIELPWPDEHEEGRP